MLFRSSCNWYVAVLCTGAHCGSLTCWLQACQSYVASLWLLPAQFNVLMPSTSLNPSQVSAILKQVSFASGAEVVFKGMCFEMHGLEHEVRAAITMLLDLDIVKVMRIVSMRSRMCAYRSVDLPPRDSLPD